jgi:hypothetical protein
MKLFYIGEKFYNKSGSIMSPIYKVGSFERTDWGKVRIALDSGEKVDIRPANKKEIKWAYKQILGIS